MPFGSINLPPGVMRNGTQYQVKGRWYDANLIRWYDGIMRPVGGWSRVTGSTFTGKGRAMLTWRSNAGTRWVAVGTSSKLYANGGATTIYDITPVSFTAGSDDAVESLGYTGGVYGTGLYGAARAGGSYAPPTTWMLDTWGEYLVGCSDGDGKLYEWTLGTGSPAAVITNAPTSCLGLIVSEERHLFALGAGGNPRSIKWSDREANTVWTPAETNEAGGFELQTNTAIMAACRMRGSQILVVTQSDAHVIRYIGSPFYYSRDRIAEGCGAASRGSLISVGSQAFWMGPNSFWKFDGAAVSPMLCDVSDYIFQNLNRVQIGKIVSGHNPLFGEVWWHYTSVGATENDRYVIYNYREDHWSIGQMSRTAWHSGEVFGKPLAVGSDGYIYRHEEGWLDNGASRFASMYADSGVLELDQGERVMDVHQIIPDEQSSGEVTITAKVRYAPNDTEYTVGPYTVRGDGYTDTRFSGRQVVLRLVPTVDDDFRVGKWRLDMRVAGGR